MCNHRDAARIGARQDFVGVVMATEKFTARATADGRIFAVSLDHNLQPVRCYDSNGDPFEGYITMVRVVTGGATAEMQSVVDARIAQQNRGAIYATIGVVLRELGVQIPDGWRAHELPPGLMV